MSITLRIIIASLAALKAGDLCAALIMLVTMLPQQFTADYLLHRISYEEFEKAVHSRKDELNLKNINTAIRLAFWTMAVAKVIM